jgi:hypothetical protein
MLTKKIFIHIPKNAGCTILMGKTIGDRIIPAGPAIHKNPEYSKAVIDHVRIYPNQPITQEHARWVDLDQDITKAHKAFSIIRNPWDRVVSRYFYALKNSMEPGFTSPVNVTSFDRFLDERFEFGNKKYMWHSATRGWYPATDYVTDKNGKLVCDMLSFENIDNDICDYFNLKVPLTPRNVTGLKTCSYMDMYKKRSIRIVSDLYQSDIDMFGYDFDSGPTKNTWNL